MPRRFGLTLMIWLLLGAYSRAETVVPVWTYYTSPPYGLHSDGYDLTSILCVELTRNSQGKWRFEPQSLPRKRIDNYLERGDQAVVAWVSPSWFGDPDEVGYDWTRGVVWGRNEIVSLKLQPVEYDGPESLIGKSFGGVLGHRYVGIDELVAEGRIRREDASSFSSNFGKLLLRRIEVTMIPREELFYLMANEQVGAQLYVSKKPHQSYQRKMLVTKNLKGVRDFMEAQWEKLNDHPDWRHLLQRYGLDQ
ncbi:amino acid ABC transporter substrate-binding protein [Hahella aquimaris]|uniref:amino acid ABC transporter substrate-binding protein n=1 Tax=Hahella sp. HNIBRBA332 TaxID=3015983 RepID=UPI00273B960B|nr:amino acid ABC transporter substrate-binding protein [Hahella sp. HNIBRBA332]WLQ16145.1 amino acid ABC transporter substrate-binding protein [Hahella sp. HNIBRBA332]